MTPATDALTPPTSSATTEAATSSVFERARPLRAEGARPVGTDAKRPPVIGRAAVLGAGPAGLAQASLLLKRASSLGLTELTVVELRAAYTRPVGLALRQTNLDALAWLNPDAYAELAKRSGLTPGTPFLAGEHWDDDVQAYVDSKKPAGEGGDPARFQAALDDDVSSVAEHAQSMLAQPTMALLTLKDVEECYWKGLEKLARANGVTLRLVREHDVEVVPASSPNGGVGVKVTPKGGGASETLVPQDLVVVAQGVNCAVRRALGTPPATPASPPDRYIAAVFQEGGGATSGPARSTYREDVIVDEKTGETATVRLVRGRHARNGSHWCLAQVPAHVRFTSSIDELSAEERMRLTAAVAPKVSGRAIADADLVGQKVAEEVEAYFRAEHSKTGPADLPITYGPSLFTMQAKRFQSAQLGANAIAVGDAVGASHFNVSGGAATGITTHTIAFDRFLETLAAGGKRDDAMKVLDRDLQQATLVWQLFGITQFEGDPATLRDTFYPKDLCGELLPPEMLERYFPRDGGVPASSVNPAWHSWLSRAPVPPVPANVVTDLVDATVARGAQVVPWTCDIPLAPAPSGD